MRASRTRWAGTALLAALVVTACGGNAGAGIETAPRPAASSTAELEALYRARTDSARMRFTGADVHFVTGMIGHHAQALVMAGLAPTHGAGQDELVFKLASDIQVDQTTEIARMELMLSALPATGGAP